MHIDMAFVNDIYGKLRWGWYRSEVQLGQVPFIDECIEYELAFQSIGFFRNFNLSSVA